MDNATKNRKKQPETEGDKAFNDTLKRMLNTPPKPQKKKKKPAK